MAHRSSPIVGFEHFATLRLDAATRLRIALPSNETVRIYELFPRRKDQYERRARGEKVIQ